MEWCQCGAVGGISDTIYMGHLVVLYGRNNDSDSACGLVLIIVSARTRLLGAPYITRTVYGRIEAYGRASYSYSYGTSREKKSSDYRRYEYRTRTRNKKIRVLVRVQYRCCTRTSTILYYIVQMRNVQRNQRTVQIQLCILFGIFIPIYL